jgi:hypothetical protein
MNLTEVEQLLEKYYNAETTLSEEKVLQKYFNEADVPDHLLHHKEQFIYYYRASNLDSPDNEWKEKLDNKIKEINTFSVNGRKRKLYNVFTGIAASILILVAVYFQFFVHNDNLKYSAENTYEDPEKAYQEAKNTLLMVSEKLNSGVSDFNKFSTFNQYKELITRKN